eukprot:jgi/Mesvir1/19020/Mv12788-RA.1
MEPPPAKKKPPPPLFDVLQHGGPEGDGVGSASGSSCGVYVYDLGSTHGTFVNKRRVKPNVHVPLQVGDMLKFGLSTRSYILQGPPELMPEEGLSRTERQALRKLEAEEAARVRQQQLLVAQQNAAAASGASWGFGEDAIQEEDEDEDEEVTWENFKGTLTEKQQKHAEKLRNKQQKMEHLRAEISNIQAKEMSQGGLTQGQQTQISRNEQRVDELMREFEELEETLNESIRESIRGRSGNKEGSSKGKVAKRKGGAFLDSDDEGGDSDDDDFYDRSAAALRKRQRQMQRSVGRGDKHGGGGGQGGARGHVETAESLWIKRAELEHRIAAAEAELAQQRALQGVSSSGAAAAVAEAGGAGGGESMTVPAAELSGKESTGGNGAEASGGGSLGAGKGAAQVGEGGDKGGGDGADASVDPLDAFMTAVTSQVERDGVLAAQRRLDGLRREHDRVCALLKMADPSGLFVPSASNRATAAATAARTMREEAEARRRAAGGSVGTGNATEVSSLTSDGDASPIGPAQDSRPPSKQDGQNGGGDPPGRAAGPNGDGGAGRGKVPGTSKPAHAECRMMPPPPPVPTPQWLGAPKPPPRVESDGGQGGAGSQGHAGGSSFEGSGRAWEDAEEGAAVFLERKVLRAGAGKGAGVAHSGEGGSAGAARGDGEGAGAAGGCMAANGSEEDLPTAREGRAVAPAGSGHVAGGSSLVSGSRPPGVGPRSYGPTMPPALARRDADEEEEEDAVDGDRLPASVTTRGHGGGEGITASVKPSVATKRPVQGPAMPPKVHATAPAGDAEEVDGVWAPPEGQTGDGKTTLNAKFGY